MKRALVLALAVIVLAAGMAAAARPAAAQTGLTFTVGLQPGWNLVGWVEPEASVQHFFDTIPRAEVVFAWDAKEQRFRGAYADPSPNSRGDLDQVTPGMGLWVWLGGTDPFAWRRPVSREPTVDSVSLQEGWNLVAWTGLDGVGGATGLGQLADDLARVMIWDAEAAQFVEYNAADSASAVMPLLRRGGALWVSASTEVQWEQAVVIDPTVVFHGGIPEALRVEAQARVHHMVTHYAERFGKYLSGVTFHVTRNNDVFRDVTEAEVTQEARDAIRVWTLRNCGVYVEGAVFWDLSCQDSGVGYGYFSYVLEELGSAAPREAFAWMRQGWRAYEMARYRDSVQAEFPTFYQSYESTLERELFWVRATVRHPVERPLHYRGPVSSHVGFLATDWLIRRSGDYSFYEYDQAVPWAESWENAFSQTFGLTPEDFFEQFEAYVATTVPVEWPINAVYRDTHGGRIGRWFFRTSAFPVASEEDQVTVETFDRFSIGLTPGAYEFSVAVLCESWTIPVPLGWYHEDLGLTADRAEATKILVGDPGVSLEIRVPTPPDEISSACELPPRLTIEGVVTGPRGEPVPNLLIKASPIPPGSYQLYSQWVGDSIATGDGTFRLRVLDDRTYRIRVLSLCNEHEPGLAIGTYDAVTGLVLPQNNPGEGTHVIVHGEDVTGIHARLPEQEYRSHLGYVQRVCGPPEEGSGQ